MRTQESDMEYKLYRRPTVIYNTLTYEIIRLGEYDEINDLYTQFLFNCNNYGLIDNPNYIGTFEIKSDETDEDEIVLNEEFLKKYINKNIEKFLNNIIGTDHRE